MRNSKFKKESEEPIVGLPSIPEVEEVVLGAILLEPSQTDAVMQEFEDELFYSPKNKVVAGAICRLYKNGGKIDAITVCAEIAKVKGDVPVDDYYVFNLCSKVASSANTEYHVKLLQQAALRRTIIKISGHAIQKSMTESNDIFDTYEELQKSLDERLKALLRYDVKSISSVHEKVIIEGRETAMKGGKSGVLTGLEMVDNLTNGWQESDLIILAGRPSMGKTAAAVSMIKFPAINKGIPVAIFSLEMSADQLVGRLQSGLSGINVSRIIKKQTTVDEIDLIERECAVLKTAPIYIDDTPNISLIELKNKTRRLVKEKGVKMIVIDYLQLMRGASATTNREQEIAEISRGLKGLAKELTIPIIALSQLSRSVEARGGDKKPMLQDLRESGQIEQDADMVLFCYRPEYYDIENYEVDQESFSTRGLFMLIVAKHRNGELGEIPLRFIHEQTLLTDYKFGTLNQSSSFKVENQKEVHVDRSYYEDENPF